MTDVPAIDPVHFARLVAEATEEQLEAGLSANRELILNEVFRRMPDHFRGDLAPDLEVLVEWRITGRPDGGEDRWQIAIERGSCRVERDGDGAPALTFTVGPVDFLRLATGNVDGPQLFLYGRLEVDGDLVLATRIPTLFIPPRPDGNPVAAG